MSTVTFDTLEAARRLRDAGFDEKQAEAVVRVLSDAQDRLVTREHFDAKLEAVISPLKTDLAVLKWGMGLVIAGVAAQLLRVFFT